MMVKFSMADWVVKRNKLYLTCSNDYRIKEYSTDLASCKADAEAEGATHIYWQKGEWSFQGRGTKLERFLHKNQHAQRKLLNFENWTSGEPQKLAKIRVLIILIFHEKKLNN